MVAPVQGEFIWVEFDPSAGREQRGRRPALVVSSSSYNQNSSVCIACPVTTGGKPWPWRVALGEGSPVQGWVLVDQIKTIDLKARAARKSDQFALPADMKKVLTFMSLLFNMQKSQP